MVILIPQEIHTALVGDGDQQFCELLWTWKGQCEICDSFVQLEDVQISKFDMT